MTYARTAGNEIVDIRRRKPTTLKLDDGRTVTNPDAAILKSAGWVEVQEVRPTLPDGKQYGPPTKVVDQDGNVTYTYPVEDPPPAPRDLEAELDALEVRVTAVEKAR